MTSIASNFSRLSLQFVRRPAGACMRLPRVQPFFIVFCKTTIKNDFSGRYIVSSKKGRRIVKKTDGKKPKTKTSPAETQVAAWENDPFSQSSPTDPPVSALPILRPVPQLSSGPLPSKIKSAAPPAKQYPAGTSQFRYWVAAEALRRAGDF